MDAVTMRLRDIDSDSDTYSLTLESPYLDKTEKIEGVENYSSLRNLTALRESLEQDTAGGRLNSDLSPERAVKLLEDFRELGSVAFITLMGGSAYKGWQGRVKRYLKDVLDAAPAGQTPVFAVSSPVDLPLDLMTVMHNGGDFSPGPGSPQDQARRLARQAAECFIGFRFAVRKTGRRTEPVERSLANADGVSRVYPYWHQGVRASGKELARLREFPRFDVADPMPDFNFARQDNAGRKLARRLVRHVDEPVDIVHVTCHCESKERVPPLEHKLILAAKEGFHQLRKVDVAVRNIKGATQDLAEHDAPVGPLAFLSACAAADVSYQSPTSIPDALLDSGYRAVIAPLVSVHFNFALEMAMTFYAALGKNSNTVGGALVDARAEFLKQHCNPLGLLYSCYGDSGLG